ncbi:MAG: ADP-ribose diphosphatase [Porticoccaceae bacterium]|nr:ADP-ribose diphosphatase [Porticoccaceae bacterium]
MLKKRQFKRADMEVVDRKTLYSGFYQMALYRVRHRLFGGGWSQIFDRELFERVPAVGVLLYDPKRDLVGLVEQFRIGALEDDQGPWQYEIVAGLIEEGESPEEVARREMVEEAGVDDATLIFICDYLVSPGGTNERMTLYCGLTDLEGRGGVFGLDHENEDIRLNIVSRQDALAGLAAGQCNNAPLTIALQWLALHYEGLKAH